MYQKFLKRIMDLCICIIALPLFVCVFIIIAPIIYLTDKGSVFYTAQRVGKNGKKFNMYKFRSMYVNSPDIRNEDGSTYNGNNDSRVTPIGRFIRKTSIDELPQFLNVFLGQMSLIGPRPNLVTMPYHKLPKIEQSRLKVKPGITGYNQAYFRNSVLSEGKFINDVYYVEHISWWLDIKIFLKTIQSVIKKENIYV